ncbi:MAG: DUF6502 family protein [Steroidobacteraceae bacterium]
MASTLKRRHAARSEHGETPGRTELAQAAMTAIEPVVELLLQIGITSPEAESLLRSLFVHRARAWLTAEGDPDAPSDVRVALVTGIHRNFVAQILLEPPKIARTRERRGMLAGRLLHAWHTDSRYRDAGGRPRDLPVKGVSPSFAQLVAAHGPGASAGVVLRELVRAGAVEMLGEHRVRVRTRTLSRPGIHLDSVTAYGLQARALLSTLTRNLCEPGSRAYCETTPAIRIAASRMMIVREVVARRAGTFLSGLAQELEQEGRSKRGRGHSVQFSLNVMETSGPPTGRVRRRREKTA